MCEENTEQRSRAETSFRGRRGSDTRSACPRRVVRGRRCRLPYGACVRSSRADSGNDCTTWHCPIRSRAGGNLSRRMKCSPAERDISGQANHQLHVHKTSTSQQRLSLTRSLDVRAKHQQQLLQLPHGAGGAGHSKEHGRATAGGRGHPYQDVSLCLLLPTLQHFPGPRRSPERPQEGARRRGTQARTRHRLLHVRPHTAPVSPACVPPTRPVKPRRWLRLRLRPRTTTSRRHHPGLLRRPWGHHHHWPRPLSAPVEWNLTITKNEINWSTYL